MGSLSIWHYVILFVLLVIVSVPVVVIVAVTRSGRRPAQPPRPSVQPGWYPDSADPRLMRWFDGQQWTDRVQQR